MSVAALRLASSTAAHAILGAILAFPDAVETRAALDRLGGDHFAEGRHRVLFEAVCAVVARGALPDLVSVTDHLRMTDRLDAAGGILAVTALLDAAPAIPALVGQHLDALDTVAARTRAARLARELAAAARARDPFDALQRVQRELQTATIPGRDAVFVRVCDVQPVPVRWAWPGRVALGKVILVEGDPGLGKSTLMLDIAARITTGRPMPDGTCGDLDGPAGVVILSAEDDVADTIRPRLDAAGADVERVVLLQAVRDAHGLRGPTIADLGAMREAAQAAAPVAAVIIDPLMAHLPEARDSHRDQDVRRALAPLAALAAELGAAIVVIRHLNKTVSTGNPLYRGGGSIGIIGAARAGLLVVPDPDDQTGARRILAVTKSNLAALAPALAYRLTPVGGVVRVEWEGTTTHTAAALLAAQVPAEERPALDEAVAFLQDVLAAGPRPAAEVKVAAREAGIAERTLERSRYRAGIRIERVGFPSSTVWALAAPVAPTPNPSQDGATGPDGATGVPLGFQPLPAGQNPQPRHGVGVGGTAAPLHPFVRRAQEVFAATILSEGPGDA